MLKNEFKLVGVVVKDFEEVGTENFSKKKMLVEVERKGKIKSSTYPIVVYGSNTQIDTSKCYIGQTIVLDGYIDVYKDFVSLIAQEMYVVGDGGVAETPSVEIKDHELEEDDLPF